MSDNERDLEEELAGEEEEQAQTQASKFIDSDKIIKATDIVIDPTKFKWKVFLAGSSGSGKTMGMTTLPGRKLLIDFDNRAETVVGIKDVDIYRCYDDDARSSKPWQKAEALRKLITTEVRRRIFPYDTVIFDGLTMMGHWSLCWALTLDSGRGLGGSPSRQHYGPQMDNLKKYVVSVIALPLHIGFTGHIEYIEEEDSGRMRHLPKITGKLRTEVANWFNETYYCTRTPDDQNKLRYYWTTAGSGRSEFFKSSLNQLGRYWKDPIEIDFDKEKVGFQDLFERRFSK